MTDGGAPGKSAKSASPAAPVVEDIEWVPQCLLRRFTSMVDASLANSVEAEITRHCAHAMPAVALCVGREQWPQLADTYRALAADRQWKVRLCIAQSIHHLAVVVGQEYTSRDLVPIYLEFMRDLDEVRVGILEHLHEFFEQLPMSTRERLLDDLNHFMMPQESRDYRFRLTFLKYCSPMILPRTLTLVVRPVVGKWSACAHCTTSTPSTACSRA